MLIKLQDKKMISLEYMLLRVFNLFLIISFGFSFVSILFYSTNTYAQTENTDNKPNYLQANDIYNNASARAKVPSKITNQIVSGFEKDVIVLFETQDVEQQALEQRQALGLDRDNQQVLSFKVAQYQSIKRNALTGYKPDDLEKIQDYSHLPMAFVRVKNASALSKLANNPTVKAIYENKQNQKLLEQSLPLIHQPESSLHGFTGAGTTVAVLDSGVDYTRQAFGACTEPGKPANCRVIFAQDFAPDDGLLDDDSRHGTNVAGIVLGVAPETQIVALDVFPASTAPDNTIINAINWVIANSSNFNIVAMNLSLGVEGSEFSQECPLQSPYTSIFENARAAGVIPVVASGNDGFKNGIATPACTPGAVRVGAVYDSNDPPDPNKKDPCVDFPTETDQVTCFSNSATILTLLAPGQAINAAGVRLSGTSQATPHVAGAIAVLRAPNAFPDESLEQTISRLVSTGKPITDPINSLVKPRLDLEAAVNAEPLPLIESPFTFKQVLVANGVTTDNDGNVYVHYDDGFTNVVSKFTSQGVAQWTKSIGGFGDINRTGRLATLPGDLEIIDLLQTGELLVINQESGEIVTVFDLRTLVTVDASTVYDVSVGIVRNMSDQILQPNIIYGDVDIWQQGEQFDIYATGLSSNSGVPFVIRIRFIPDQPVEAKVLLASSTQFGGPDGAVVVPRGLAINQEGVILTSLPVLGPKICPNVGCSGLDVGFRFDVNYEPEISPAPGIILSSIDLHSRGMSTDSQGNFYLATGDVGSSLCGQFGSGALVVVSESTSSAACGIIGSVLAGSQDVAINPFDDTAYMTLFGLFRFNGVLQFPIQQPAIKDSDQDGVTDNIDNCLIQPNPSQIDTNTDGIGDACQCGDANRDGKITNLDASRIRASLLDLATLPANSLCDTNNSGSCTNLDASRIRAFLFGRVSLDGLTCREKP